MGVVPQMLTFVNKGTWLVKNSQKDAYVIYERPLIACISHNKDNETRKTF